MGRKSNYTDEANTINLDIALSVDQKSFIVTGFAQNQQFACIQIVKSSPVYIEDDHDFRIWRSSQCHGHVDGSVELQPE